MRPETFRIVRTSRTAVDAQAARFAAITKPIRPPGKDDGSALTRSRAMTLVFIAPDKLSVSKTNMRYARKAPDVSDILLMHPAVAAHR